MDDVNKVLCPSCEKEVCWGTALIVNRENHIIELLKQNSQLLHVLIDVQKSKECVINNFSEK